MEATSVAERFQVPSIWSLPRVPITFRLCLCASLLMHGLVLVMSTAVSVRGEGASALAPLPALNVHLHMKINRVEATSAPSSPVAAGIAAQRRRTVQAVPARSSLARQEDVAVPTEPEPRTTPSFDPDELRAQARSLANNPPAQLVRSGGAHRNLATVPVQDSLDRPILEALSKRLGKTLVVASEQVMSDGSRMIRFAGNTCLRVPQHLPEWQKNAFGATVLVPMTCAN